MKILVVEDDPRLREAIVDTLMLKRYDVTEAKNGKEAVVLLQEMQPDLVLTDINMPEMTGLELLAYIKQCKAAARHPVRGVQTVSSDSRQRPAASLALPD